MKLIWATRGRDWGFRFLLKGGYEDPLPVYESVFGTLPGREGYRKVGDKIALRFPDPELREDASGRVIPHEFVVLGERAAGLGSFEEAFSVIWPLVAGRYEQIWNVPQPPRNLEQ
ncbi:hypothetical protein EAH68_00565 [Corynebacterium hylobatis]|uniref:Uncharacterized protein n=1 Tax=Corynebacterium hylobatis TaxID=1859290 RepID=A0A430I2W1_9CORY|nr:hypothetical protein [Corynebacterium hylobatis]RSZ66082.1 hypothetical protein EAH68_00565 [Corynebacterium hylobatis]